MKTKAIVVTCDRCGARDILRKVTGGPSNTTDNEGYETMRLGWETVVRYPNGLGDTRQLCPKCAEEYRNLINRFWKQKEEKEHD